MKKQVVVIGAGSEAVYAITIAKKRGYEVIAFDGNPNADGLKYADISYVTDIRNPENITKRIVKKPEFILPVPIGRYLTSIGAVNDALGLCGISKSAAINCTDKYRFHQKLFEQRLRLNECILIPSGTYLDDKNIKADFFPFILKPRYGSGSKGVYRIDTEKELKKTVNLLFPANEDYIAETLFMGTEYGADGFIFQGKLYLLLIREKLLTNPPYCQCVGYISLNEKEYYDFYQMTAANLQKIADSLEMDNCIFHCDFMKDDMHTNVIEISARPSGHNLHNLFTPFATGVSMIDTYIDFMENHNFKGENRLKQGSVMAKDIKTMLIGYFDFEDCMIVKIPSATVIKEQFKDSLVSYECHLKPGYMEKVKNGAILMKRGFYILEGKDRNDLLQKRQILKQSFS